MLKNLRTKYLGESALLIVTLFWGATFVIVKESLGDISSMLFIAFRFTIAGILFTPFIIKKHIKFTLSAVISGGLLGLLLFGGFATQTVGLKYTLATKSGFITGSSVVMIPIFQTIIEKRLPTKGAILGTAFVLVGILFLSSGGNSIFTFLETLGNNFNFGDFLTLICAVFFALYVVYLDIISKKYDFWLLIFMQIAVTGILSFVAAFLFGISNIEPLKVNFSNNLIFGLLYTSIFATLITTALQTKYQQLISPTKAGIIFSFEPLFAALFAFFVISEKISTLGLFGGLLIFVGLLTSELFDVKFGKLFK